MSGIAYVIPLTQNRIAIEDPGGLTILGMVRPSCVSPFRVDERTASTRIGSHTCRHSFGRLLKANREDVKTVQKLSRHANSRVPIACMLSPRTRLTDEKQFAEFIRPLIFSLGIGNNDMHLKNWSLIYSDGHMPQLSPAYDFVSGVRYLADDRLALSIAREKAANQLNVDLLERFARRAQVPTRLVLDTAQETADRMKALWQKIQKELSMDRETRHQVTKHIAAIPLFQG